MLVITTIQAITNHILKLRKEGKTVGFVPTMGALHTGHISLINRAKRECDVVVCSVFVNPTQFNDPLDFEKYPNTLLADQEKLIKAKCHILFLPTVAEMYPQGTTQSTKIDFGYLAQTLEGEFRPGHFDGMAQIVKLLLLAVCPTHLYMGQKDYQQAMICRLLIKTLKLKIALIVCPIKREPDGLAMSSRNVRLSADARQRAVEIIKTLKAIKRWTAKAKIGGSTVMAAIEKRAAEKMDAFPEFEVEYIAIRNATTLKPIKILNFDTTAVALIAARIEGVRLIDNMYV